MTDFFLQQLQVLGLTQNESQLLKCLIENSPCSATYIAKSCKMSRSSVYTLLSSLIAKGFVATTYKNDVKQFTNCGFSAIEEFLQNEKDKLKEKEACAESLKKFFTYQKNASVPNVIFFEGIVGLKRIYRLLLREADKNSTMYVIRDKTVLHSHWNFIFEEKWQNLKKEKNIETVLILNNCKEERLKISEYKKFYKIKIKFIPKKFSLSKFSIIAIHDTVAIISFQNNLMTGIKITNNQVANNFRQIFLMLSSLL